MKSFAITSIMLLLFIAVIVLSNDNLQLRKDLSTKFIWNDDEESIPRDGSLIRLEFTDSTGIYIGPYLDGNKQYILELVNDAIRITEPETERLIYIEKLGNSPMSVALLADSDYSH